MKRLACKKCIWVFEDKSDHVWSIFSGLMRQDKKEVLEVAITIMVGLGLFKEDSQGRLTQWEHYGERRSWAPFRPVTLDKCHGHVSHQ